ncbi:MAG: Spy/CpxP family protein refolding chaperone [Rhodocyclaceae bacterium]|nr:Spy/CpxP family protein refolding chaperone [Rhodocyclaceae bacterium]
MKRSHQIIAGLIVAAGISSVAFAQQTGRGGWGCDCMGPMGMGPMSGQGGPMGKQASMKFDPAVRAERRLEFFKGQLKLTSEQEPLWQAFAGKAKDNMGGAGKGMMSMRDQSADANLTAPERMAKMQSLMQERLTAMTGVHESFNRLYAALTPEQKKVADQHAAQMGRGGMGGKGGKPGPGRMMPPAPQAPSAPQS